MITSAYSPTATERVLPRMALDFTTASLDSRVTVTRALNTATAVNSAGVVAVVNANLPRFDYDPVTLACKGLLIEGQRTNLALYSQTPSDATWSGTSSTKTSTNNPDPFGTTTALLLTANGLPTSHFLIVTASGAVSYTSGTSYTISCFMKAGTTDRAQITFPGAAFGAAQYANYLLTGSGSVTASTGGTATITQFPNGYYRLTWTATATITSGGSAGVMVFITSGTDARLPVNTSADNIYIIGWQTEAGAFVTSYIPTTTTSLTRNADVVSMTGTSFSDWWQDGKGSALVKAQPGTVSGTRPWVQFDDATANNIIALRGNTTNPELYIRSGGSDQAQIDAGTIAANTRYRLAGAWATNDCAASINSGTPALDGSANIPVVTQARLGSDGTNYLNGHLEAIQYYTTRMLSASLQVVSSTAGYRSIINPVFADTIIS